MANKQQLIVQIGSLADFCQEVPVPAIVRLNLTEKNGSRGKKYPIPTIDVRLDLYGVNEAGEIVWLHTSHETERVAGKFLSQHGEIIYDAYPEIKRRVADWLTAQGYEVRGGGYAIDKNVLPARGVFECAHLRLTDDGEIEIADLTQDQEASDD